VKADTPCASDQVSVYHKEAKFPECAEFLLVGNRLLGLGSARREFEAFVAEAVTALDEGLFEINPRDAGEEERDGNRPRLMRPVARRRNLSVGRHPGNFAQRSA